MEIDGHFTKRRQEKHVMEVEIFKTLQFTIIGFVYYHPQYIFVTFDFNSTANRCWHRGRRNSGRSNAGY